ncbi:tRNA (cytidine(34)-2'-O)-methyltransferase [Acuticoccus sp.]|uniref:tRNA (cytidine(34)-2'-O)-methyltransferase n=1 Tax=Acuticoccus sp. TaxID=1904378 RepID=UPI003B52DBF7
MDIALYQPEIPQNTAAILRTAGCLGAGVHLVGAPAFDLSTRAARRAGLDYVATVPIQRHATFADLRAAVAGRIVLFTTHADLVLTDASFGFDDTLLFGREGSGVPTAIHDSADERVRIPLVAGARSLNLAVAVGIGLMGALNASGALARKGLR